MFLFIGIGLRCRGVNLIANQSFDAAFQNSLDSKTEMAENSLTGNGIQPSAAAGGCPPVMSWFVMRVTYSREMKAQALLQSAGIECFVPMRTDRSGAEENRSPRFTTSFCQDLSLACRAGYSASAKTARWHFNWLGWLQLRSVAFQSVI